MKLSNMFKKTSRRGYISLGEGKPAHMAPEVPEGLLKKCNVCKSAILTEDVKNGYYICPKCQNYFRVHAMHRIEMVGRFDVVAVPAEVIPRSVDGFAVGLMDGEDHLLVELVGRGEDLSVVAFGESALTK